MSYTHLTMEKLGWIDSYFTIGLSASEIIDRLGRSKQPIYNVIKFLKEGNTIQDYYREHKEILAPLVFSRCSKTLTCQAVPDESQQKKWRQIDKKRCFFKYQKSYIY